MADNLIPFDKPKSRRHTRAANQSKETDLISFRASTAEVRKMDEIAASRIDPALKTRSDIINDAIHQWLDKFFEENPDGLPMIADRFRLEHLNFLAESRETDLHLIQESTDRALEESNQGMLQPILLNAMRLKNEIENDPYGSPKQKKELVTVIQKIQRAMGVTE